MSRKTDSTAVMQRRVEPKDSLDDFPSPPWATRALMEHVIFKDEFLSKIPRRSVLEPTCGRGHMASTLEEYFGEVVASDVHDYGYSKMNFCTDFRKLRWPGADWIVMNPPFRLAEEFVHHALFHAMEGVAVFERLSFLEGQGRYNHIFREIPPTTVAVFSQRVALVSGRIDKKAQSATSYAWFVWGEQSGIVRPQTNVVWIPPCRKELEKDGDYAVKF